MTEIVTVTRLVLPGQTPEEVVALAKTLPVDDWRDSERPTKPAVHHDGFTFTPSTDKRRDVGRVEWQADLV